MDRRERRSKDTKHQMIYDGNPDGPKQDRLGGRDRARHRQARQAHQGRAVARLRGGLHDDQRRLRPRPTIRADRPGLRSDWLNGKSHDNFAPMGRFLVPRAFVPDHRICSSGSRSTAKSGRTATPRSSSSRPKSKSSTLRTFSRSSLGIFSAAARAAASVRAPIRFLKLAT